MSSHNSILQAYLALSALRLLISPNQELEETHILLELIQDHAVFMSDGDAASGSAQTPVEIQLAVTLYRMGRYGNGASVMDVANWAGVSEGSVLNYTKRCLKAIESLQQTFVRKEYGYSWKVLSDQS